MPDHSELSAQEAKALSFHLAEKNDILVVSLIGAICKATEEIMRRCTEEIERSQARSVVLNFLGVENVEKAGLTELAKVQVLVRRKPSALRICFMRPAVAAVLKDSGVLRPEEVSAGLKEAIVGLAFKRAAA